jgi:tRNA (guanine-N7-)-methyltransferase
LKSNTNYKPHPLYSITSNQRTAHTQLSQLVKRHADSEFLKPLSNHSLIWWQKNHKKLTNTPLILDSGCGKGRSSCILAEQYPHHTILAIDQSKHRLQNLDQNIPSNVLIALADCVDIWRLCLANNCQIDKHLLLYPNPWPKKKHLLRRWHGHPCFPLLIQLSQHTHIRSNWLLYIQEFAQSASILGKHTHSYAIPPYDHPLTHFETKYFANHVPCYGLDVVG